MESKTRWILFALFILVVVIVLFTYLFVSKEFIFAKYTTKTYSDGCIERFKNGVATTQLCSGSRARGLTYYG